MYYPDRASAYRATALRGLVARTGASSATSGEIPRSRLRLPGLQLCAVWSPGQARQAPPPGKCPVALTRATALRGLVARTGASSAASGKIPGCACAYRGYGSARYGSPDRRVKRRLRGNPRPRSRLPGLQLCAVWSPGQARQAPPPGKPRSRSRLPGLRLCAVWSPGPGASSAASGKMPGNKSHFLIDLIPTQPDIF